MTSRRVKRWVRRLDDAEFVLVRDEQRVFDRDRLSMAIDDVRGNAITTLFREQYSDIAPALAEQFGVEAVGIDDIQIKYDYHLRQAHASLRQLRKGARISFSADMVNVLFSWIRNVCTTLSAQHARPEPEKIVVSRVAKALDLATAPMYLTRQYWKPISYHVNIAETFTLAAERFVLAHEIAHIYLTDDVLAARTPDWSGLSKVDRSHRREITADMVGLHGLLAHARQLAARRDLPIDDFVLNTAVGSAFALGAMDLLERFDVGYATPEYPRVVLRRAELHKLLRSIDPQMAARVDVLEVTADRIAGRALQLALRRRRRAAEAAAALLAAADGTGSWSEEDFDQAMRATLRHSRRGTLDTLAGTLRGTGTDHQDERRRATGFVERFLVKWQGEPVYLPFLEDVGWMTDE